MATNLAPGQEEHKGYLPNDGSPDSLRRDENLENADSPDNQPAGNPSDPRGHDVAAGDPSDPRGEKAAADTRDLAYSEAHPGRFPGGYKKGQASQFNRLSLRGRFSRTQKLLGLGGLTISGGIIAFILFFLPFLRLESYLASINQRAFAIASNAVSERTEHLFERYMINRVLNLDGCNNAVSNACNAYYRRMGPAGALFNAWRDVRIEQKLIDQYDLKFETHKNPGPGQAKITIRSAKTGDVIKLTEGQVAKGQFSGGRREFGREVNKFLRQETRWYQVMQRHSVRKYLVRKHGTKFWCFLACKTRDTAELKAANAKTRFKYKFTERIVFPFSGKLGFIMTCIIDGGNTGKGGKCSPEELRKRGIDRDTLADKDINKIVKDFKEKPNARLGQYLTQKLLEKIMSKQAARSTLATIPIAGQIYLGAVVVDMFDRMDGFIKDNGLSKFAADLNARQYLEYYTAMRSADDEMKAGASSVDEVGAIMSDFDGAEESKVYQAYHAPQQSATAFLGGTAVAAENDKYRCGNSKPIPKGELVCPEKKVARSFKAEDWRNNDIVDGLASSLNLYDCSVPKVPVIGCPPGASPKKYIRPILGGIDKISGTITRPLANAVFSVGRHLPYIGSALSFAEKKSEQLLTAFLGKIFPLPVQLTDPGREKYDGLEAGGEVAASEFGKGGYTDDGQPYGLGGKLLSASEQKAITQAYDKQQEYDYSHSGLLAKLSNLDYPNSIANNAIAAVPSSLSQLPSKLASLFARPFLGISLLSHSAYAAQGSQNINAFGIPRFGYALNDPVFSADPAKYTKKYCEQVNQRWEKSKIDNPVTGIDEYSATNPCLLEEVAVEAASSAFTQDDDLGEVNNTNNQTPTTGSAIVGDIGEGSAAVACAAKTKDLGVVESKYSGEFRKSVPLKIRLCQLSSIAGFGNNRTGMSVSGGAVVNSRVSGAWQALGEKAKLTGISLSSSSSFRLNDSCGGTGDSTLCARPGQSAHQLGIAIDFAETHIVGSSTGSCSGRARDFGNPTWAWLHSNAELYGFKQYSYESWHWDPLPLSNRCGSAQ